MPKQPVARFVGGPKPGRNYEQIVKAFEPYDSVKGENPEALTVP